MSGLWPRDALTTIVFINMGQALRHPGIGVQPLRNHMGSIHSTLYVTKNTTKLPNI